MREVFRSTAAMKTFAGVMICTAAAAGVSVLGHFYKVEHNDIVPLAFLLIVGLVAWFMGTWAALLGLISGSAIFVTLFFPPQGKLALAAGSARMNIAMMLLFGIGVAYFYGHRSTS